jgi:hypothetical protein
MIQDVSFKKIRGIALQLQWLLGFFCSIPCQKPELAEIDLPCYTTILLQLQAIARGELMRRISRYNAYIE